LRARTGAYRRVEHNIILGWKGLPETKKTSLFGSHVHYGQHNVQKCDTQLNGIQYCHPEWHFAKCQLCWVSWRQISTTLH